jgi:TIR domain
VRSAAVCRRSSALVTYGVRVAPPGFFISYSHADKALARSLAAELERSGSTVWVDENELRIGDSITDRIATAVAQTRFFIAFVSEAAVGSRWCRHELALAMTGQLQDESVRVMPVRVGGVEMPNSLKSLYYVELDPAHGPGVREAAKRLIDSAESYTAELKTPGSRAAAPASPSAFVRQSRWGRWTTNLRRHPIRATLLGLVVALTLGIAALTGGGDGSREAQQHEEYARLRGLHVGAPIATLTDQLGTPEINEPGGIVAPGLQTRVWVRRLGTKPVALVLARVNNKGSVVLLAITALDRRFRPTFPFRASSVTLNETRLADELPQPDVFAAFGPSPKGDGYYFESTLNTGAEDFHASILGVAGIAVNGRPRLPIELIRDAPGDAPRDRVQRQLPHGRVLSDFAPLRLGVAKRFWSRPRIQALRRKTVIDTYGVTSPPTSAEDVGAPRVSPIELRAFLLGQ